jgi:hypothetical protein
MRIIEAVDRADRHPLLRRGIVPLVYVLGVVTALFTASTIPPAGRSEGFSLMFFGIALAAPVFATLGKRAHAQVGWMVAWLGLPLAVTVAYWIIGVEYLIAR